MLYNHSFLFQVNPDWKNPEGIYRIGMKNCYDLYPDKLKERMKSEYKKKNWDEGHRKSLADITREISEFEAKHPSEFFIKMTNLN